MPYFTPEMFIPKVGHQYALKISAMCTVEYLDPSLLGNASTESVRFVISYFREYFERMLAPEGR